jgi:hypothetical protein
MVGIIVLQFPVQLLFPFTCDISRHQRDIPWLKGFSWEEKLVAPLIATPNVDRAIEDKKDGQKSYATG